MLKTSPQLDLLPDPTGSGERPYAACGGRWRLIRPLPVLAGVAALAIGVWAATDPRFRNVEGFPRKEICLPLAASMALMVVGLSIATRLRRSGLWLALSLIGQAAALQLIDAGTPVRYQHYRAPGALTGASGLIGTVILVCQTLLVGAGVFPFRHRLWHWLTSTFRWWQLAVMGLVFVLTSATLSWPPSAFAAELCIAVLLQAVSLANVVLVVVALPPEVLTIVRRASDRLFCRGGGTMAGRADYFGLVGAVWVTIVTAGLSYWIYERHPHVPDEVVYLYHARYFAAGQLTMPAPPVPAGFDVDLMQYEDAFWYCPVPPGWPAALAIGVILGVPWLANPVLTGVNVLLAYSLLKRIYVTGTARLAILLLCVSPWNLFMGMSLMTHAFSLCGALTAALATAHMRAGGRAGWGLLGGAAIGLVSLTRPLEGVAVAVLLGLWALRSDTGRWRLLPTTALALGTIVVGSLMLPYNYALTGNARTLPIEMYSDRIFGPGANALGFGPNRGVGWTGLDPLPGHGALDILINANFNLFLTNVELFGWATGSLVLVALAAVGGGLSRGDRLMLAVIGVIIGIHSFYYFSGGPDFGARYWYLILVPCAALTARGIRTLATRLALDAHGLGRMLAAVGCLSVLAIMTFFPWRALDKYHHYRKMRPDIRELAKSHSFGRCLVLVRGNRHPDYASAVVYNPLDLHADAPIYAWDRDAATRARLLKEYANRPVWMVNGPTITGRGFEVVEGPTPAASLLTEARANEP